MKAIVFICGLVVGCLTLWADETNLTVDGSVYTNVVFLRATPCEVHIRHSSGLASIPLEKLPAELQKRFGYDPQKALDYRKEEASAQAVITEQNRTKRAAYSLAQKEKQAHQAVLDSITAGGVNAQGNVVQTLPDGAVIGGAFTETSHLEHRGGPDAGGIIPTVRRVERHYMGDIVVLGPISGFASGHFGTTTIYPAGSYQMGFNVLKCYAISPEVALARTLSGQ